MKRTVGKRGNSRRTTIKWINSMKNMQEHLSKNNEKFLTKQELEPIINSFMVSFDVNYISNSENFKSQDDIICIKMKNSLPINYYLKKMDD